MGIAFVCAALVLAGVSLGFAARVTTYYRRRFRDLRYDYAAVVLQGQSSLISLAVAADREAASQPTVTPGMDALRRVYPALVASAPARPSTPGH
jgi:hypothetical protein